jgi:hypothetical protein
MKNFGVEDFCDLMFLLEFRLDSFFVFLLCACILF